MTLASICTHLIVCEANNSMGIAYVWQCALCDYGCYNLLLINGHNCSSFPLMFTSPNLHLHMVYNTWEPLACYQGTVYAGAHSSTGALWLLYSNKCTLLTSCRYTAIQVQVASTVPHCTQAALYYPARMRRGKVIGLSVRLSVVTTKIARSRHLGTWATRKRDQSVGISDKLAWICFESLGTVHERHK